MVYFPSLYKTTQVKSGGEISKPYVNHQGVKQGGILSAGFYKAYNNDILNTLERNDMLIVSLKSVSGLFLALLSFMRVISVFLLLIFTLSSEVHCSIN
jgi:hypothetical protein